MANQHVIHVKRDVVLLSVIRDNGIMPIIVLRNFKEIGEYIRQVWHDGEVRIVRTTSAVISGKIEVEVKFGSEEWRQPARLVYDWQEIPYATYPTLQKNNRLGKKRTI